MALRTKRFRGPIAGIIFADYDKKKKKEEENKKKSHEKAKSHLIFEY